MKEVTFFGNTDMGRKRTNNEDSFAIQQIWDDNHILAVAIDGVGGYEGGEVAAEIARKSIVEYLENYADGERIDLLKQAVIFANNNIFAERKNQPQYANMSCVLTAIIVEINEQRINMAHVGDTRLYQYSNGEIRKLSHDHSLVGYREEIGELSEEEAMKHPQRNIIGRDVGSSFLESNSDYVETATFPLEPKSDLLLCSDGLCDMITSAEMKSVLEQEIPVEKKVNALISAANEAGGKDNVTVLIVETDLSGKKNTKETIKNQHPEKKEPDYLKEMEITEVAQKKKQNPVSEKTSGHKTNRQKHRKTKDDNGFRILPAIAIIIILAIASFFAVKYGDTIFNNPPQDIIVDVDTTTTDSTKAIRLDSLNNKDTIFINDSTLAKIDSINKVQPKQ